MTSIKELNPISQIWLKIWTSNKSLLIDSPTITRIEASGSQVNGSTNGSV
jgi:hypothetical protein